MDKREELKEQFDALYAEWLKVIQNPKVQISSRPQDYTNNEPYREIVEMGRNALPFIREKIEQGEFLMNEAALKIAELDLDKIIGEEAKRPSAERIDFLSEKIPKFLSEQQKSKLILKYIQK